MTVNSVLNWLGLGQNSKSLQPVSVQADKYIDTCDNCINDLNNDQKLELAEFVIHYNKNKDLYNEAGFAADVPNIVVAAIHYRESSGDFKTYLSQGDPLGTRTYANGDSNNGKSLPDDTPNTIVFSDWKDAAIFALKHEFRAKQASGITYNEKSIKDMLTFCEYFNGLGYQKRNLLSPYNYSCTSCYKSGKFTSDGNFDEDVIDKQLGVLVMLRAII